ncbi:FecR family protein [Pedobacter deserti]|uniref:FecR family protein n=1 Tax=Pedobacter deserti TaxID=2817382 RepID=UPI00210A58FB|nr:FecR family protein [Pedobacter sp. SYSU D00382]
MDKTRIVYLHTRYLQKRLTLAELEEWKVLLNEKSMQDSIEEVMDTNWEYLQTIDPPPLPPGRSLAILNNILANKKKKVVKVVWPRLAVAAAVGGITFALLLYYNISDKSDVSAKRDTIVKSDILPGGNKATLRLSNGQVIDLSAQKSGVVIGARGVTYSDGATLKNGSYSKEQTITASTPRGGMYHFVLPDGSKVYLNAATTMKFPSAFNKANRVVELVSGEAYFEVAKDKNSPFVVESTDQQVEVLGTRFNISAYPEEIGIATTLLEGSVRLKSNSAQRILAPGMAALNNQKGIQIYDVNAPQSIAWTNNKFVFANEDIETIMRKVARWYNVQVYFLGEKPLDRFEGTVSRFERVSKVLRALESTGQVHFKIEGRAIYVFK